MNTIFQDRIHLLEQITHELLDSREKILQLLTDIHTDISQLETSPQIAEDNHILREHLTTALELSSQLLQEL